MGTILVRVAVAAALCLGYVNAACHEPTLPNHLSMRVTLTLDGQSTVGCGAPVP